MRDLLDFDFDSSPLPPNLRAQVRPPRGSLRSFDLDRFRSRITRSSLPVRATHQATTRNVKNEHAAENQPPRDISEKTGNENLPRQSKEAGVQVSSPPPPPPSRRRFSSSPLLLSYDEEHYPFSHAVVQAAEEVHQVHLQTDDSHRACCCAMYPKSNKRKIEDLNGYHEQPCVKKPLLGGFDHDPFSSFLSEEAYPSLMPEPRTPVVRQSGGEAPRMVSQSFSLPTRRASGFNTSDTYTASTPSYTSVMGEEQQTHAMDWNMQDVILKRLGALEIAVFRL